MAEDAGGRGAAGGGADATGRPGDAAELRVVAVAVRDLAGRMGIPEVVHTPADALPGATTGNVVYDLGIALSVALGDLAEYLAAAADEVGSGVGDIGSAGDPADHRVATSVGPVSTELTPAEADSTTSSVSPSPPGTAGRFSLGHRPRGPRPANPRTPSPCGGEAGPRVRRTPIERATTSFVHPWMVCPPQVLADVVAQLDGHARRLDELLTRAAVVLPDGLDLVGVDDVATAVDAAGAAFGVLLAAMDAHVGPLRQAEARLAAAPPWRWRALRAELRAHTDALSAADAACRRGLEDAVRATPDADEVAAAGGWVRGLALAASLASLRPDAPADELRAALAALPASTVAAGLPLRPDLVAVLVADDEHTNGALPQRVSATNPVEAAWRSVREAQAGALGVDPTEPIDEAALHHAEAERPGASLRAVVAVREAFGRLDPAVARLVALTRPALVGDLDGAPVGLRVEVNRLHVRAALGAARHSDVEFEARAIARRVLDDQRWWRRLRGAALDAWLSSDALTTYASVVTDRPLLLRADLRIRVRLFQSFLYDQRPARRLLEFDPRARGRIVELWGAPPESADRIVVFVPGTGTAVRGFHLPTRVAAETADAAATAGAPDTCALAWMGADFPYSLGTNAPFSRFAKAAAAPLRDVVEALDPRPGAVVTVVGHSYGGVMVGAAERAGLRADRVVHLSSAGAGPGVEAASDYPDTDPLGRARRVARWAITAPGDLIVLARATAAPWRHLPRGLADRVAARVGTAGLGVDPADLAGTTVLPAGVWEEPRGGHAVGEPLRGRSAHAHVFDRGTTSFRHVVQIATAPPGTPTPEVTT